jgi:hypothetical protein
MINMQMGARMIFTLLHDTPRTTHKKIKVKFIVHFLELWITNW